jgi:hypothetical protein
MKRVYVYQDGKMIEKIGSKKKDLHYIQDDIKPYKSMADGTIISSRSQHRRHLKRHNCIEVGNEIMRNAPPPPVENTRKEVLRAQLANMTHDQANRIMNKIRDDMRFSNYPHRKG